VNFKRGPPISSHSVLRVKQQPEVIATSVGLQDRMKTKVKGKLKLLLRWDMNGGETTQFNG
jgi:hypothetical protein